MICAVETLSLNLALLVERLIVWLMSHFTWLANVTLDPFYCLPPHNAITAELHSKWVRPSSDKSLPIKENNSVF